MCKNMLVSHGYLFFLRGNGLFTESALFGSRNRVLFGMAGYCKSWTYLVDYCSTDWISSCSYRVNGSGAKDSEQRNR